MLSNIHSDIDQRKVLLICSGWNDNVFSLMLSKERDMMMILLFFNHQDKEWPMRLISKV
jgi:hypothetical protein